MSYHDDYIRMQIDNEFEAECDAKNDALHADDPRPCADCGAELPPSYLLVVNDKEYCSVDVQAAVRRMVAASADNLPF